MVHSHIAKGFKLETITYAKKKNQWTITIVFPFEMEEVLNCYETIFSIDLTGYGKSIVEMQDKLAKLEPTLFDETGKGVESSERIDIEKSIKQLTKEAWYKMEQPEAFDIVTNAVVSCVKYRDANTVLTLKLSPKTIYELVKVCSEMDGYKLVLNPL